MADLTTLISSLSADKRALLERRLMERRAVAAKQQAIPRRTAQGQIPLSFAQELMWLLDNLVDPAAYHVPRAMHIEGPLDFDALQYALDGVVKRHEILRTTYRLIDGTPFQFVNPTATTETRVIDLSGYPLAERKAEADRLLVEEGRRRFDLTKDPLLRAVLVKLAHEDYLLLFLTHHIASDGESREVLFRELQSFYSAHLQGKTAELPELPIQYADFAIWQRELFRGEILEKLLSYWKERLGGAPNRLEFPTDHPRPAAQDYRGAAHSIQFPPTLLLGLKQLAMEEGATLFMTALAAFSTLLFRYSGQQDVVIGTPVSGRNRTEIEPLIGYFSNSLALRFDLSGNPTFRELIRQSREVALGAFSHQELPFERLVVELQQQRDLSFSPIYQVMFSVGEQWRRPLTLPGVRITMLPLDLGTAKFDLNLGLGMNSSRVWGGMLTYCTALFDHTTIVRVLGHFQNLVEGAIANPDERVRSLPLLSSNERTCILSGWNSTQTPFPEDKTIHAVVEAQVERTPDVVAVAYEDDCLTYRDLDRQANHLAGELQKRGIGPGIPVGVYLTRSLRLPIALLAVLKAGGVCVPLDPNYPQERIAMMLDDVKASVVISEESLGARLGNIDAELLMLHVDLRREGPKDIFKPRSSASADDLAYIIFTSGSTGRPRGVMLTHRGLVNQNTAAIKLYELQPADRMLQFSSLSFDIAIEEIFPILMAGGTLVIRPDDLSLVPPDFSRWISDKGITVLDLPTAFWHTWVHSISSLKMSLPKALRLVILGGEKASLSTFAVWKDLAQDRIRLVNTYGPTEASIIATSYAATHMSQEGAPPTFSIGRPIANTAIYILDRNMNPVPVGVSGEIYIGGVGIARGYLGRPEVTAERFVANPFSQNAEDRLYRTGDLARYLPDGNIDFLGRVDNQIKIRGYRLEPGDIEASLSQHPAILESCILVTEDTAGEKKLVAYCLCSQDPAPNAKELRNFLKGKLPEYMVPSSFIVLDSFPLTPNGKVDANALREKKTAVANDDIAAPSTEIQQKMASLWSSVLQVSPIGIHDNFFELGGHSLLAIQVISRVRSQFDMELPLRVLFENPTVAELCVVIEAQGNNGQPRDTPIVPVRRESVRVKRGVDVERK